MQAGRELEAEAVTEPEKGVGMESEAAMGPGRRKVYIKLLQDSDFRTKLATIVLLAKSISFAIMANSPRVSILLSSAFLIGGIPMTMWVTTLRQFTTIDFGKIWQLKYS
ncbi:MAG: hypothetical protein JO151_15335, partial [Verrucomicrobia bacterium]|nr:hypothetical protein [Verrucomicrobiota bacterium]